MNWPSRKLSFDKDSGIIYVMIANSGIAIMGAGMWFVLAALLNPGEYGEINYYISAGMVASVCGLFGLSTINTTHLARKQEQDVKGILFVSLTLATISSLVLGIFFSSLYIALLSFSIITFTMSVSFSLGLRNYKEYAILLISQKAIQIILVFVLFYFFGFGEILLGYALAYLVLSYKFFQYLLKSSPTFAILRKYRFAAHALSNDFSQISYTFLDKLIIAPLFGFVMLGLYQISSQFLMVLAVVPSAIFFYLLPKESAGDSSPRIRQFSILVAISLAIILFFFSESILSAFFPMYLDALPVVRIIVFGIVPMTVISFSNSKLLGIGKSVYVFIGTLIFLVSEIVGFLVLSKVIENLAIPISILTSLIIQAIFLYITTKRYSSNSEL